MSYIERKEKQTYNVDLLQDRIQKVNDKLKIIPKYITTNQLSIAGIKFMHAIMSEIYHFNIHDRHIILTIADIFEISVRTIENPFHYIFCSNYYQQKLHKWKVN